MDAINSKLGNLVARMDAHSLCSASISCSFLFVYDKWMMWNLLCSRFLWSDCPCSFWPNSAIHSEQGDRLVTAQGRSTDMVLEVLEFQLKQRISTAVSIWLFDPGIVNHPSQTIKHVRMVAVFFTSVLPGSVSLWRTLPIHTHSLEFYMVLANSVIVDFDIGELVIPVWLESQHQKYIIPFLWAASGLANFHVRVTTTPSIILLLRGKASEPIVFHQIAIGSHQLCCLLWRFHPQILAIFRCLIAWTALESHAWWLLIWYVLAKNLFEGHTGKVELLQVMTVWCYRTQILLAGQSNIYELSSAYDEMIPVFTTLYLVLETVRECCAHKVSNIVRGEFGLISLVRVLTHIRDNAALWCFITGQYLLVMFYYSFQVPPKFSGRRLSSWVIPKDINISGQDLVARSSYDASVVKTNIHTTAGSEINTVSSSPSHHLIHSFLYWLCQGYQHILVNQFRRFFKAFSTQQFYRLIISVPLHCFGVQERVSMDVLWTDYSWVRVVAPLMGWFTQGANTMHTRT